MEQTSIEWFADKIDDIIPEGLRGRINILKEQAKEMEKQQIIDASNSDKYLTSDFIDRAINNGNSLGEQYYNDKFNK
jgi:hypothetical protein